MDYKNGGCAPRMKSRCYFMPKIRPILFFQWRPFWILIFIMKKVVWFQVIHWPWKYRVCLKNQVFMSTNSWDINHAYWYFVADRVSSIGFMISRLSSTRINIKMLYVLQNPLQPPATRLFSGCLVTRHPVNMISKLGGNHLLLVIFYLPSSGSGLLSMFAVG